MLAHLAVLCLVSQVLSSPCTDESCDLNQDSHLLQVSGKSAEVIQARRGNEWSFAPGIEDACVYFDGSTAGPGATGLLEAPSENGDGLSHIPTLMWQSFINEKWKDGSTCKGQADAPWLSPAETRCVVTYETIEKCFNAFTAFLTAHEDGMAADSATKWKNIKDKCVADVSEWDSHNVVAQLTQGTEAMNKIGTTPSCVGALEDSGYFCFGKAECTNGWGSNLVDFWEIDLSSTAAKHEYQFSYPETEEVQFVSSSHGLPVEGSWSEHNPKFCGGQMNGNVGHRCLSPEVTGGNEIALSGDDFQHVTLADCKNQAHYCSNCIHMGGRLTEGMNGVQAKSLMWFQISPGSPSETTTVGKCCFFSEPCDEAQREGPRHRQNVISGGIEIAELGRIAYNLPLA